MLTLGIILLMPTAIFASNYDHSYNNGQHNRYPEIKPGSNLIFNFEQLRRDQPPQIEMRDESLGLYMHARPKTTTTMAPIAVPEMGNNEPFSTFSNLPAPVHTDYNRHSTPTYHQYNYHPSTPMPSPPPAPKWSDFSETFNKQAFPHYESQKPLEQTVPEFNYLQQPQRRPSGAGDMPQKQIMPSAPEFNHFQRSQHQSTVPVNHDFRGFTSTTPEYKMHEYVPTRQNVENNHQQQNASNRGNHKFSWNDLVTEPSWAHKPQLMSSTSTSGPQGKNPPSVPTLSPWLDGFGK